MKKNIDPVGTEGHRSSPKQFGPIDQEPTTESNAIRIPAVSLPKGGGAIRGIDEKFSVNPTNGTAALSIPLPLSSGRNGFSPDLSLSYNSGNGNGPFGLGWSLQLPTIGRKTDKRIPRYQNDLQEDTFLLAGAEDLVPFLENQGGQWLEKNSDQDGYAVKRYRPRIEGAFSRVEQIRHSQHGTYWRVTTRNNFTTIFGRSADARIANPEDPTQIFQWMPEFSYDDRGNWVQYEYKPEDLSQVPALIYEQHRLNGTAPFTNRYLKRVRYGNALAYYADPTMPYDPQSPTDSAHFFELLFDYGEHTNTQQPQLEVRAWDYRPDAFSSYRSGFEIRTNRLCKRILMFHHFPEETQFTGTTLEEDFGQYYLVRSLDLSYEPASVNHSGQAEVSYLQTITESGYVRRPDGGYSRKALPPFECAYRKLEWNLEVRSVSPDQLVHAPVGLADNYHWVDLYGEGIAGILTEQGDGWYYKRNRGEVAAPGMAAFTAARKVISRPSFSGLSNGMLSVQDLEANGEKQVVVHRGNTRGYFELLREGEGASFHHFEHLANVDLQDPNVRFIDLDGDGRPELVVTEENAFLWYASAGKQGHLPATRIPKVFDEDRGPAVVFADTTQTVFLADMSGDGLTDIVRIRNGEICYWGNRGYGSFSARISMSNAPYFDHSGSFNPKYLYLADVSGTGTTDILYLDRNKCSAYLNLSGNAWSDPHRIEPCFPHASGRLSVVDLLGTGTPCLVWSSELASDSRSPMRYIDLMDGKKPHVLIHYQNNLGQETSIHYKSSTHYYLQDELRGSPWLTKLPFPVQVVSRSVVREKVTDVRFSTEYHYHHGYYDHAEREFRGFGMVEQIDTEQYVEWDRNNAGNRLERSESFYQPPVLTKTWFYTGAFLDRERILQQFQKEYWYEAYNRRFPAAPLRVSEPELPDALLAPAVAGLGADEYREALRACKGMKLRQEVFALDAAATDAEDARQRAMKPYSVTTHNCRVNLLQPRGENLHAVFLVTAGEDLTLHYERDETDPRIAHNLPVRVDDLGNVLEAVSVVYGRNSQKSAENATALLQQATNFAEFPEAAKLRAAFNANVSQLRKAQERLHITLTQNSFADYRDQGELVADLDLPALYRTRLPYESGVFEITGITPANAIFTLAELMDVAGFPTIGYHEVAGPDPRKRLIEQTRTRYRDNDGRTPLPFGEAASGGLVYEDYQLAYTPELIEQIYQRDGIPLGASGTSALGLFDAAGGYTFMEGNYWIRSGIIHWLEGTETMAAARARFFSPLHYESPTGLISRVQYDTETVEEGQARLNDGYYLFVRQVEDPVGNRQWIDRFNFRTLSPARMIDINANPSSVVMDELGMVKALAVEGNGYYQEPGTWMLEPADELSDIREWTDTAEQALIFRFLNEADTATLRDLARQLLGGASSRFVHDLDRYYQSALLSATQNPDEWDNAPCRRASIQPGAAATIVREKHASGPETGQLQLSFAYTDGFGRVIMAKTQAEPGAALQLQIEPDCAFSIQTVQTGDQLRWIGNGRTVLNNKGNPVRQYEPYFSTTPFFEDAAEMVERGVTPLLYYDPLGRSIRTEYPDGTFTRTIFSPWEQRLFDQNDNVLDSDWYLRRTDPEHPEFINGAGALRAATQAAVHADTPAASYLDALGRPVLSVAHNGGPVGAAQLYTTFIELDIEGNTRSVRDARGNVVTRYQYDLLGHRIAEESMDDGRRWYLQDVASKPYYRWDDRDQVWSYTYDEFDRLLALHVRGGDGPQPLDHVYECYFYGENQPEAERYNLRGQLFALYDSAGKLVNESFDFKGNLLRSHRRIAEEYREMVNWRLTGSQNDAAAMQQLDRFLDAGFPAYRTEVTYDALNRPLRTVAADGSIHRPVYNEAGLLESLQVALPAPEGGVLPARTFVRAIDYDEKGRRVRLQYADAQGELLTTTRYHYDPLTFRLTRLQTMRQDTAIQDLRYTYDPMGNITEVEDGAVPTRFFGNFRMEARSTYTYDSLYRLVEASGREHAGQAIDFGGCDHWHDRGFRTAHQAGDDMAWRPYLQEYGYDPVGNILRMRHRVPDTVGRGWSRDYSYAGDSNRLLRTQVGDRPAYEYDYHPRHGLITALPHLSEMQWNTKNELQQIATQQRCSGEPAERTWYVYDSQGERIRKVTERSGSGLKRQERLYLGGVEIFRSYSPGGETVLERSSLHITDDSGRIALVDTRTSGSDAFEPQLTRFQFGNHLGSATLELDDSGRIISYEEYHPYGTTAYQAVQAGIRATAKRFRYTGMERDEESGLNYHSARYYLPWLGRWLSADPIGIICGANYFEYSNGNPVIFFDTDGNVPKKDRFKELSKAFLVKFIEAYPSISGQFPNEYGDPSAIDFRDTNTRREQETDTPIQVDQEEIAPPPEPLEPPEIPTDDFNGQAVLNDHYDTGDNPFSDDVNLDYPFSDEMVYSLSSAASRLAKTNTLLSSAIIAFRVIEDIDSADDGKSEKVDAISIVGSTAGGALAEAFVIEAGIAATGPVGVIIILGGSYLGAKILKDLSDPRYRLSADDRQFQECILNCHQYSDSISREITKELIEEGGYLFEDNAYVNYIKNLENGP